jgi:formiminoglutamase
MYLSLNLETFFESAMGVSTPCLNGGLSTEEALEICYFAGLYGDKVAAVDICEYNPYVEDWKTGRLVATMFYYFTLGLSQRLQKS